MRGTKRCRPRRPKAVMAQEAFSDYHLYTLGRKTTINNNETKQVSMLSGTGVPVLKRYVVNGQAFYYRNYSRPGSPLKDDVQVFYQFKNEQKAGLGMPMPAGVVRVYQADSRAGPSSSARIASTTRRRTRPSRSRSALPSTSSASATRSTSRRSRFGLRGRVRDHAAQPQGDPGQRGGERADWRHLEDDQLVARVEEDGRVGLAVHGAGRREQRSRVEVSRPDKLLIRGRA